MAEEEIRAERIEADVKVSTRRIELVDDQDNLKLVLDGGGASGDEYPGLIVYGPVGPSSAAGIRVDTESGQPSIFLRTVGGGLLTLTFVDGAGAINIQNEDSTEETITVSQE
jgi:hypothetical protein